MASFSIFKKKGGTWFNSNIENQMSSFKNYINKLSGNCFNEKLKNCQAKKKAIDIH